MNTQGLDDQDAIETAHEGAGRSDAAANRAKSMFKLAALVAFVIACACIAGKIAAAYGLLHSM
jgi:hypothetical protein